MFNDRVMFQNNSNLVQVPKSVINM